MSSIFKNHKLKNNQIFMNKLNKQKNKLKLIIYRQREEQNRGRKI